MRSGIEAPVRLRNEAAGVRVSALFERHGRGVYALCRMLLRDDHEAEDAVQSSFLAVHRALARGGEPRDPRAWLYAIARNECRGRLRAQLSAPRLEDDRALDHLPSADGDPAQRMTDPTVRHALAALPERQREAVVLHDVLGLRSREVGGVLGLSLPAVEALLFRARRQLRVRLRPVSGALVMPFGLRDALVQAIPGFGDGSTAAGSAATGVTGIGLLAKMASAPAAAKVAAATVAVTAAGTVVVAESDRGVHHGPTRPVVRVGDPGREPVSQPRISAGAPRAVAEDEGPSGPSRVERREEAQKASGDDDSSERSNAEGGGSRAPVTGEDDGASGSSGPNSSDPGDAGTVQAPAVDPKPEPETERTRSEPSTEGSGDASVSSESGSSESDRGPDAPGDTGDD